MNRKAESPLLPIQKAVAVHPSGQLDLVELLEITEEEFRDRFQGTSIMRAKRVGMQKNACVALGNNRDESGVPALVATLKESEALVRGHAAWALGQISSPDAIGALEQATTSEVDPYVLEEIGMALAEALQRLTVSKA